MPYITREDGERFVIPSYRDVISAKKKSLLKKEILLLSTNYGEYITLHRKNVEQYEVAFSPDTGYLLGETVWHYFKRPLDLIYCEAIPNTTEAILVVVKAGSVYLDGSFPIDSIAEELVIFRTQQNNFDIHIYGEVPISQSPEEGKFTFDLSSVKSFEVLEEPVFNKLPKVKNFQLQLVDTVLKSQGIGVLPIRQVLIILVVFGAIIMLFTYISTHKKELPQIVIGVVNPYQVYIDSLTSPDPVSEIYSIYQMSKDLYTMPGWFPVSIDYSKGKYSIGVRSGGTKTILLLEWAKQYNYELNVKSDGFYLAKSRTFPSRYTPETIVKIEEVIGALTDRLSTVLLGNHLSISAPVDKKLYKEANITIAFSKISPSTLDLIGLQFHNLPVVLTKVSLTVDSGKFTGTIMLQALGY